MVRAGDEEGVARRWASATTGSRRSRRSRTCTSPPGGQPADDHATCSTRRSTTCARNDLITVPQVAAESLHMIDDVAGGAADVARSSSAASQILVSYPTDTMEYDARLQSMRGNNPGFSHATAFHEMIPGPQPGRLPERALRRLPRRASAAATPFYGEGWPLYWELTLYDLRLPRHAGAEGRRAVLAHAPLRAHHLLAATSTWASGRRRRHRLPRRQGRPRARQRDRGSAPVVPAAATATALPGRLPARRPAAPRRCASELVDIEADDEQAVPRRDPAPGQHADRADPPRGDGKQKLTRDMDVDWKFYGDNPAK